MKLSRISRIEESNRTSASELLALWTIPDLPTHYNARYSEVFYYMEVYWSFENLYSSFEKKNYGVKINPGEVATTHYLYEVAWGIS